MFDRRTLLATVAAAALSVSLPLTAFADEPVKIVASFSILGDMVKEIGKDHVVVTTLVGPDGDAHVYEPTPADARNLAAADVLVLNGLEFESWLPRLVSASGFEGIEVVASQGVAPLSFEDHDEEDHAADDHDEHGHEAEDHAADDHGDHDHGGEDHAADDHDEHDHEEEDHAAGGHDGHDHGLNDPHAWQDLANGVIYARNIAAMLAEADQENAADYEANAEAYVASLEALDAKIRADIAEIPADRRKVVTSHDAFAYFGDAYGIEFIAPTGMSTEAEASAADVARIIDQIRADNITAVFVENITNTRLIEQIVRETGATVGGKLYSDALSDTDGPAPTYLKMFESNAEQLAQALGTS